MKDSFYTPSHLAKWVVSRSKLATPPSVVADFAVGDGTLLKAAMSRWPWSRFLANDVDSSVLAELALRQPTWWIGCCDFFSPAERAKFHKLEKLKGGIDLILLNPPFSNRGSHRHSVPWDSSFLRCSRGLAFIISALEYLSARGELLAILPASTLHSEMDSPAWGQLLRCFKRTVLRSNSEQTFPGCLAKTVVVLLEHRKSPRREFKTSQKVQSPPRLQVVRGKVDMPSIAYSSSQSALRLIHTTDLCHGVVRDSGAKVDSKWKAFSGSAVLLPRVGRPSLSKVCTISTERPVACSNCVVAVLCTTRIEAQQLSQRIKKHWQKLLKHYGGTCAQYITLSRFTDFLREL